MTVLLKDFEELEHPLCWPRQVETQTAILQTLLKGIEVTRRDAYKNVFLKAFQLDSMPGRSLKKSS